MNPPHARKCARCIHTDKYPMITFNEDGVCNYCLFHEKAKKLNVINVEEIFQKKKSSGKYDCLVPVSGGLDSTYVLYLLRKKYNLKPLAFNFDNGWQHVLARENVERAAKELGCDLRTVRLDGDVLKKMYLAFLKASVPDVCAPCMVGIYSFAFKLAMQEKIPLIITGTSLRKQGAAPITMAYTKDGRYFKHVIERHAPEVRADNYCAQGITDYFKYLVIRKIKIINLPDYLEDWNKEQIRDTLKKELGWNFPEGRLHRFDCVMEPFRNYWIYKKFGFKMEEVGLAAQVRSGDLEAEEALNILSREIVEPEESVEVTLKGLGITRAEFNELLEARPKTFRDYPSYHSYLMKLKEPIKLLVKMGIIQEFVYDHYFKSF